MRRALFGGFFVAGVAGFMVCLWVLTRAGGTCASGGPYVIADECPGGMRLPLAILGSLALIIIGGIGVGAAPRDAERPWIPLLIFVPGFRECALFGTLAAAVSLLAASLPDADPDGRAGAAIFAGVMLLAGPGGFAAGRLLAAAAERR